MAPFHTRPAAVWLLVAAVSGGGGDRRRRRRRRGCCRFKFKSPRIFLKVFLRLPRLVKYTLLLRS